MNRQINDDLILDLNNLSIIKNWNKNQVGLVVSEFDEYYMIDMGYNTTLLSKTPFNEITLFSDSSSTELCNRFSSSRIEVIPGLYFICTNEKEKEKYNHFVGLLRDGKINSILI